jgi:signal transduction histidine kinase
LRQANQTLEQRVQERTSELLNALNRLAELNQLKANFIANISHELRTPLTHIKGYLELILEDGLGEISPELRQGLTVAWRSGLKLEKLIEDLIQFSLAARGQLSLHLSEVELVALTRRSTELATPKAGQKQLVLQARLPAEPVYVRADPEKLTWVLDQLLDNAIKFTPEHHKVWVSVERQNGLAIIAVTDNGIGIPPERLDELFLSFHQLDNSNTRHYSGTGIGLALVQRIIEAHGSHVQVDSRLEKGSRFEFSLPVIAPASAGG